MMVHRRSLSNHGYGSQVRYPLPVVLAGCIDYGVYHAEPEPAPDLPEIEVSPQEVSVDGVCVSQTERIRVLNFGQGELTLQSATIVGEGWQLIEADFPTAIAANGHFELSIVGSVGDAVLTIVSDDADEPEVSVTLSAANNVNPFAVISAPAEDGVLPEAGSVQFTAFVSDTEQSPSELAVRLFSDVVGEIAIPAADSNGRIDVEWVESARVAGPQTLQLQVEDACGAIGESSVYFCQDGEYVVSSLSNHAWHTEGAAVVDQSAGNLMLGPEVGAAFDAFAVYDGDRMSVQFTVATLGGAGFAMVALDAARMSSWIGGEGCGLGFAECNGGEALPGWALAFDLTMGDENDCGGAPAVSFVVDGAIQAPAPCAALPEIADGLPHEIDVAVDTPYVKVKIDGVLILDANVGDTATFPAYLGFSGADGTYEIAGMDAADFTCANAPD